MTKASTGIRDKLLEAGKQLLQKAAQSWHGEVDKAQADGMGLIWAGGDLMAWAVLTPQLPRPKCQSGAFGGKLELWAGLDGKEGEWKKVGNSAWIPSLLPVQELSSACLL